MGSLATAALYWQWESPAEGVSLVPRVTASILVEAPPEVVFRTVETPPLPLLPTGGPRLVRPDGATGPGAVYRWEFKRLGLGFRADSVITDYLPGEVIAFVGTRGWDMRAEARLQPESGGTRLLFQMHYQFGLPVRWFVPGALIRLGIWHAMRQVKDMAEANTKAPSTA